MSRSSGNALALALSVLAAVGIWVTWTGGPERHPVDVTLVDPGAAAVSRPDAFMERFQLDPLFIANEGQFDPSVALAARGRGVDLLVRDDGFVLQQWSPQGLARSRSPLERTETARDAAGPLGCNVVCSFEGTSSSARAQGAQEAPGVFHYLRGRDRTKWRQHVPGYHTARVDGLYAGIDLVFGARDGSLVYDLELHPGTDPSQIVIRCEGASDLSVTADGSLLMTTELGALTQSPPRTFVRVGGLEQELPSRFRRIDAMRYGFEVEGWDGMAPLTIDPGIVWATYLGSLGIDPVYGLAVADDGSAVVCGDTHPLGTFPTTPGAFMMTGGGGIIDVYVTRFAPAGDGLTYSTFLGGELEDSPLDIVLDGDGHPFVAGWTGSAAFPTTAAAFDGVLGGIGDGFLTKLTPDGSDLVFSTLLGGSGLDFITAVDLDEAGDAYVAGVSESADFPTTPGAVDPVMGFDQSAIVVRFDSVGEQLVFSTYYSGTATTRAEDIAVGPDGSVYVSGWVNSALSLMTTQGAFDTTPNGSVDGFVARMDATGTTLLYGTYLGGAGYDAVYDMVIDEHGFVLLGAESDSNDYPTTPGAYDTISSGLVDIVVTKLDPTGSFLVFSTFLGAGCNSHQMLGFTADDTGRSYVAGQSCVNLPITADSFQDGSTLDPTKLHGIFLMLDPTGSTLEYGTFLGGPDDSGDARHVALGPDGAVYLAGITKAADFPVTPGAFDETKDGFSDAWIARFDLSPWTDLGQGLAGTDDLVPRLSGHGALDPGSSGSLRLVDGVPFAPVSLVLGLASMDLPFKGGVLVPDPLMVLSTPPTNGGGTLLIPWAAWPAGIAVGTDLVFQMWLVDPAGPKGLSASNGLLATTPVVPAGP